MCHELGHAFGLPHTDENYYNRNRGDCLDYTTRFGSNLSPGKYNFELLAELYGSRNPSSTSTSSELLQSGVQQSDENENGDRRRGAPAKRRLGSLAHQKVKIPRFILDSFSSTAKMLETMSCDDLHVDAASPNVRMLHHHEHGEGCEVDLGSGEGNSYSIQIHKLHVS